MMPYMARSEVLIDMPNTHENLTSLFEDIADAIRAKTGGTEDIVADTFPTEIANIPSGGVTKPESGVIFIDYDGTLVDAWESTDVADKTALPDNPSHSGLAAQGWNWSLADIKSYINSYPKAIVNVGQMYETASGLTEIDVTITKKRVCPSNV